MTAQAPESRIAAPVLLEPRIMMDANLEWDLASTTALSGSLAGITHAFAEHYAAIDDLSEPGGSAGSAFGPALGPEPRPAQATGNIDELLDAADRVRDAFTGLRSAVFGPQNDLGGIDEGDRHGAQDGDGLDAFAVTGLLDDLAVCGPQGGKATPLGEMAICGPAGDDVAGFADPADTLAICLPGAGGLESAIIPVDNIAICAPEAGRLAGVDDEGDALAICSPDPDGLSAWLDPADAFAVCAPGAGGLESFTPAIDPLAICEGGEIGPETGQNNAPFVPQAEWHRGEGIESAQRAAGFDTADTWHGSDPADGAIGAATDPRPVADSGQAGLAPAALPPGGQHDALAQAADRPDSNREFADGMSGPVVAAELEETGIAQQIPLTRELIFDGLDPADRQSPVPLSVFGAAASGGIPRFEICAPESGMSGGDPLAICVPEATAPTANPDAGPLLSICKPETGVSVPADRPAGELAVCAPPGSIAPLEPDAAPTMAICGAAFGDAASPGDGFEICVPETREDPSVATPIDDVAICAPERGLVAPVGFLSDCDDGLAGREAMAWTGPERGSPAWGFADGLLPAWIDESLKSQLVHAAQAVPLPALEPVDTAEPPGIREGLSGLAPVLGAAAAGLPARGEAAGLDQDHLPARGFNLGGVDPADRGAAKPISVDIPAAIQPRDIGIAVCAPSGGPASGPEASPDFAICAPDTGNAPRPIAPEDSFAICAPDIGTSDGAGAAFSALTLCEPSASSDTGHAPPSGAFEICQPDAAPGDSGKESADAWAICQPATGQLEGYAGPLGALAVCGGEGAAANFAAGLRELSLINWHHGEGLLPAWLDESLRHELLRPGNPFLSAFDSLGGLQDWPVSGTVAPAGGGHVDTAVWPQPGSGAENRGSFPEGASPHDRLRAGNIVEGGGVTPESLIGNVSGASPDDGTANEVVTGLSDFNLLRLLNDPSGLLGGIYEIFLELDSFFEDFLADINLPIVGDAIGQGMTFFDNVMNSVILPALEYAETPLEDGSLPTTVDLLNGFMNDALNSVFGTEDVVYLDVFLDTSGPTADSYIYGALNFSGVIFSEMLDIDFDFGIPGLNIEVEEGSQILLELNYTVNIGFGFDIDGFFLLNDTDEAEIAIDFLVDAGTFSGSMSVLNLLGLSAKAVTTDENGVIISDATTDGGTARLNAFLVADLFGESGAEIERDFSNVAPVDGEGNTLSYERIVYLDALDFGELVAFDFGAEVDVNIGVVGNVLDPFSGDALTIGGNEILPNVAAELVLKGSYTIVDGLTVDALGINNVRVDASQLYDALVRPIVDPILAIVGPLLEVIDVIFQDPIGLVKDLAVDLIAVWFPIIKLGDNVAEIANSIAQFVVDLADAGGMVHFGSFDFTGHADGLVSGETSAADIDLSTLDRSGFITDDGSGGFGTFGDAGDGFSVDIPLIQDPFAALSLLLGDFSGVDLARARYTWFNIDADALDISEQLIDSLDVSDTVKDALRLLERGVGIRNEITGTGVTQFEVGYDMSGIENFLNSYDPFRLFDGVFIEAGAGSLVDIDMTINIFASALIASIGGGGVVDMEFNITDPNDDGKVRISELLDAIVFMVKQGAVTPHQQIAYLLEGRINFELFVEATFLGIPTTLYDLSIPPIELELYDPEPSLVGSLDSTRFGILSLQGLLDLLSAGGGSSEVGTQVLNLGARIAAANTDMAADGDDLVVLGSLLNRYFVSLTNAEGSLDGEIDSAAKAVVIPAGEGDNVIDMTHFGDPGSDMVTITYSGAGQDTITLPAGGVNIVFSGNGDDVITAPPGAQGTYIIFAEGGADTIDIPGGNVIVFSGDDFNMRDIFLTEFAQGNVTAERVRALLGLLEDDTADPNGEAFYDVGAADPVNLATLLANYTEITQLNADRDNETITVGSGNHILLGGKGDDVIRGDLDGTGRVTVLSGAGDDDIAIGGTVVYIEGGAGADTIQVNGQDVEVWGWGQAAGEDGGVGAASATDALAQSDGADIIIGGSGDDRLHGQGGDDLIEGNGGNDTLSGGLGDDVMSGGTFEFTFDGAARDIRDVDLTATLSGELDIRVRDLADGDDTMRGGLGDDILLGGGGADTLSGSGGLDLMAGDFASVIVGGKFVARHMSSLFVDSGRQGADTLDGGSMDDILLGGGGGDSLTAASGDNLLLGDFGSIDGSDIRTGVTLISSINSTRGGDDLLVTGRGNDRLIGGEGSDELNAGLGVDFLFGDNARLDYAAGLFTGHALDTDGDDRLILGENLGGALPAPADLEDFAIGGLGNDTVISANGGLTFLGDAGEMKLRADALAALAAYEDPGQSPSDAVRAQAEAAWFLFDTFVEEARTHADARDGNDRVTVAGGVNALALGGGDDRADLLDGLNHVLGDDGIIRTSPSADASSVIHELVSTAMAAASGRDVITGGDGNNVVIAGDQADRVELGDGFNLVLGDRGSFLTSNDQTTGHLRSDGSLVGGDDLITTGAGNAIIIAGQGDDTVSVGDGNDVATGDDAEVIHSNGWHILQLDTIHHVSGGDDRLTAEGTRGDNLLMGQTGDDTLDGGRDDDMLVGDNADLEFLAFDGRFAGQSALDRWTRFESVMPGVDGNDLLRSHDGTDYLIGGFGEERLFGGNGQDFLIGDTAIMTRAYSASGAGAMGELRIDTNFAFETGGYDELHGEAGFDVMIGNLGPDLFFGNTEEDALFSDGFAGYFTTELDARLFAQATPHWQLVQVNFAGPGAIDIVSKAQSASSIGLSLDRAPESGSPRVDGLPDAVGPTALFAPNADVAGDHLDALMDYVLSEILMSTIAELMAMGMQGDALRDAIAAELGLFMAQTLQIDSLTQALLLERVMTIIEDRLGLGQGMSGAPAGDDVQVLIAAE